MSYPTTYAQPQPLLDPYTPTPIPTDVPVEKKATCLDKTLVLIGSFGFVASLSFAVGCVAAVIFSGPILATGLWLAAFVTTCLAVTLTIRTIGKELGCDPVILSLIISIATTAIGIFGRIAGEELGVLSY